MKKAIVTGASGFLGAYLCADLVKRGYQVIAFYHSHPESVFKNIAFAGSIDSSLIAWVKADLSDPLSLAELFESADVVFHCAARVSFERKDLKDLIETNVNGTRNVVNACLAAKVNTLVFASSVAALGRKNANNHINENSEWVDGPFNSPYAVSKHLAELEVWRGMEEGLNVAVINPGIILGVGDGKTGSNRIFDHVLKGSRFYPSGINAFVGVEDCAGMMRLLYEKQIFGKRMLAVADNVSYKWVLSLMANTLGVKSPNKSLKGWLLRTVYFVAKFCETLRIPFPFPSSGIKSTSSSNEYKTIYHDLDDVFSYTPLEDVIKSAALAIKPR